MKPPKNHGKADKDRKSQADEIPQGIHRLLEKGQIPGNIGVISRKKNEHTQKPPKESYQATLQYNPMVDITPVLPPGGTTGHRPVGKMKGGQQS